jgi:hypothetical protein
MPRLLKVVGGVLLAIGAGLTLLGLYVANVARTFAMKAQPASGIVTELEATPVGSAGFVRYRFRTPDGRAFTGGENVPPHVFAPLHVDSLVQVRYLPDRPETHHIEGAESGASAVLLAAVGFLVVGGVLLFSGMRLERGDARLRRDGVLVEARVAGVTAASVEIDGVEQGRIEYTFADAQGRPQRGRSRMMPLHDAQRFSAGDRGYVRYERERPARSMWLGREDR